MPPRQISDEGQLCAEHREWLRGFGDLYVKQWDDLYKNRHTDAMCEAFFRRFVERQEVEVQPSQNSNGKRRSPDFACIKNGQRFYVEVTCMDTDAVSRATGLPDEPITKVTAYAPPNEKLVNAVKKKVPQCARLDGPALIAVGTYHFEASFSAINEFHLGFLLQGEPKFTMVPDEKTGIPKRKDSILALFRNAAGEPTRDCVSGVLVGCLGCRPQKVYGIWNAAAIRPLDPSLLDAVEIVDLKRSDDDEEVIEWE